MYLDPIVDIRYYEEGQFGSLNVEMMHRNAKLSTALRNRLSMQVIQLSSSKETLKKGAYDSVTTTHLSRNVIYELYKKHVPIRNMIQRGALPTALDKPKTKHHIHLIDDKQILFLYLFGAYNEDLDGWQKLTKVVNFFGNDDCDGDGWEELPYLTGFICIYNAQEDKLVYYHTIHKDWDLQDHESINQLLMSLSRELIKLGYQYADFGN